MAQKELSGKRVAILAADGFEQSELMKPQKALQDAGAEVHVISLKNGLIKGWDDKDWGESVHVDLALDDASPEDYDALMLPGGVLNPDTLRGEKKAVDFVKGFTEAGKPIAAICHGPQTLVETGYLSGKTMTSYSAVKTDMINAGAKWVDQEVAVDGVFVTSRKPDDIPAFNKKMIEVFQKAPSAEERELVANRGMRSTGTATNKNPSLH